MGNVNGASGGGNLSIVNEIKELKQQNTELKNSNNELQEALESLRNSFSGLSEKITMKRIYGTSFAEALGRETQKADVFGIAAFYNVTDAPAGLSGGYLFYVKSHMLNTSAVLIAISFSPSQTRKLFFGSLAKSGDAAVWYQD